MIGLGREADDRSRYSASTPVEGPRRKVYFARDRSRSPTRPPRQSDRAARRRAYVILSSHMHYEQDEAVWRALANVTRREMLDTLREGPRTTGQIADRFPEITRFAVMQHLRVLADAELVLARRDGRERYNFLNPVPIQSIVDRWVAPYMKPWTEALLGLRSELGSESQHPSRKNSVCRASPTRP